ncbi:MAG: hypothetical protein IKO55_08455 [Kiritimatiellae bacterium]|nr:hypothetical protein [Kiritimatiellia bacterium]
MIESTVIAINRNAPLGANAINLYSTGQEGGSNLTLGQLVMSVCIRSAAAYEAESVLKMNTMTSGSVKLDEASQWMEKIAAGTADWTAAKAFLTGTLGIAASTLPDNIKSYDKRMAAITALKEKVDALAQQQQRDMIDLQTLVNRRDVAYSTSSNVVRSLGTSMEADAANF